MKSFKKVLLLLALLTPAICHAQMIPDETIKWKSESVKVSEDTYELVFTGTIAPGWHTYDLSNEYSATTIEFDSPEGYVLDGKPYELLPSDEFEGDKVFFGVIKLGQKLRITSPTALVAGTIEWRSCNKNFCASPEQYDFTFTLSGPSVGSTLPQNNGKNGVNKNVSPSNNSVSSPTAQSFAGDINATAIPDPTLDEAGKEGTGKVSLWALILEAILWGFAMLLTPCVFPMVPMTISFFMKGSRTPAQGRFKAFMYGLFIVLLYTVPISLIILLTWIIGGEAVTADIFQWLATHWLPNLVFFAVFMIFAASFFGAFEITLPSSLVNKSDKNSDKEGLSGVFFMALTLVLVSFSCTGPIVGSVLIKSTQGEFWTPMITMLAFSLAFALPFTILALFPSLLKKMKSGSWLNSVKVVLGFIEIALGLKFLSVADQTYHWGILDREIYLAIWIVVFFLLGLYLLGKIHFASDDPTPKPLSIGRLALVIADFAFVVYLIPGMWGAPLKALSGYLPPIQTQDFVVYNHADNLSMSTIVATPSQGGAIQGILPLGLSGYFTLDEGLEAARKEGKPVFVDITGHGCVNCREMEQRVWSDPKVLGILRNDYVIVALYTDDKAKLEEKDWVTTSSGKVLKEVGRANAYLVRERFGVNAQPNYALLSPEGKLLLPVRGYDLNVNEFVKFLQDGLAKARQ